MEKYFDIWLEEYMKSNGLSGDRHRFGFDALEAAFDAGFDRSDDNSRTLIDIQNKELIKLRRMLPRGYYCTTRTCYCGAVETLNSQGAVMGYKNEHTADCLRSEDRKYK